VTEAIVAHTAKRVETNGTTPSHYKTVWSHRVRYSEVNPYVSGRVRTRFVQKNVQSKLDLAEFNPRNKFALNARRIAGLMRHAVSW
jgi:hypothetical protein